MQDDQWLAERFESHRSHLRAVAYRILGSSAEAEDAVQEAWLRLGRSDTSGVDNLGGWLTTVVGRICLDMLRTRRSRREEPLDAHDPGVDHAGPEQQALLADSVGTALLVVLDTLAPAERLAFVLHDLFGVAFEEIAPIVGRTPTAARQLASRARRRLQGATPDGPDPARQRRIVEAFLAAARGGRLDALVAVLDPDAVIRADPAAVKLGADASVHGAGPVAQAFLGRYGGALPASIDGVAGAVWAPGGKPRVVFDFTVDGDLIVAITLRADPGYVGGVDLTLLN